MKNVIDLYHTKAQIQAKDPNNTLEWFDNRKDANFMAYQYNKPVFCTFDNYYYIRKPTLQELIQGI